MSIKQLNSSQQRKIGVILSYGQTALGIIIAMVYTPFMLRTLGKSDYGLYNTVASTIATLNILDMGFHSAYIRFFTKYKVNNEQKKIEKLNGMFLTVYFVIGIIAFLCGFFLSQNIDLVFDKGLTPEEQGNAEIMFIILAINLFITFVTTCFPSYISANEKFVYTRSVNVIRTLMNPLFQIPLILLGKGSVGMTVAAIAVNTLANLAYCLFAITKLKFKASFGKWEKGLFKSIFTFSGLIAINLIVDQINQKVDNILLARFCGTEEVAVYAVGATICGYFAMFSSQISGVFAPKIHKLVNETKDNISEQRKQLTQLFTKIGRIQFLILALIASGLVFFGMNFIRLWAAGGGEEYDDAYWVVLVRVLPSMIPLIQNAGIEMQRAQNKHYHRSYILFIAAIANLIMTIFLCQIWGGIGAAIGTGLSALIANGFIMNYIYHKKININIKVFWFNIAKQTLGLLVPFICGTLIMIFAKTTSWIKIFFWIGVYCIIYAVFAWFFATNNEEKDLIRNIIKKILPKKQG